MTKETNPLDGLDVTEFMSQSRLSEQDKNKILKALARDSGMSALKVAERTGVQYHAVRTSFKLLGISAATRLKETRRETNKARLEAVKAELDKDPYANREELAERTGLPYYTVVRIVKSEGLTMERRPNHGTAVEYNHFGCRCEVCTVANRERCYAVKADMRSRPEDIPHGTMTAYWNWNCRCVECREVGSRVNKMRVEPEPGTVVKLHVRWTEEEDKIVMEGGTARSVAARLGRTIGAVNTRRATLRGRAAA